MNSVSAVQPANAKLSIFVTALPAKITSVSAVQFWNAYALIAVTGSGIVMLVRFVQLMNMDIPSEVASTGRVIAVIPVQPANA